MHAQVRASLQASGRWSTREWGAPINQQEHGWRRFLQFSVAYAYGLRALGVVLSARERDALMLLWRYVGVVMGVREDLLPTTFDEAASVYRLVAQTQMGPDDDSRAPMAALLHVPRERREGRREVIRGEIEARFLGGYVRYVLGDDAGDLLGVPDGPWSSRLRSSLRRSSASRSCASSSPACARPRSASAGRSRRRIVERMLEERDRTYSADPAHAPGAFRGALVMPFAHTVRPRYSEVDMQKVVFNGHWLNYFDDASTRFFESLGFDPRDFLEGRGFDVMVVKALLEWQGPATFDDEVRSR